jgi:3-oxoadipate enol-lactonase
MPMARINGVDIYYEMYGSGSPIVLSHGGGSNHLTWWKQVFALKEHYTVVTFDHRGFGISGKGDKGPSAFVDDFTGLVNHLGFQRTALLGQSMGGCSAAGFASRYPDRVTALILTSGAAGLLPMPTGGHSAQAAAAAAAAKSNEEFMASVRRHDEFYKRDPKQNFLFECIGLLNYQVDPRQLAEVVNFRFDLEPIVRAGIPTLLLAGGEDVSNCDVMRKLATLIPGARFESMPHTGHHLFFEKPDEFNKIVLDFLKPHMMGRSG